MMNICNLPGKGIDQLDKEINRILRKNMVSNAVMKDFISEGNLVEEK